MRRSKSDPSKVCRNYRSISRRRMTESRNDEGDAAAEEEMERLRSFLRQSEAHLLQSQQDVKAGKKRKRPAKEEVVENNEEIDDQGQKSEEKATDISETLTHEMREELGLGDAENPLIIASSRKKKQQKTKKKVELTPQELKRAKQQHKNAVRKLQQLEKRAAQKQQRAALYQQLEQSALSAKHMTLLQPSATLGKKLSQRERCQQLLHKERAGLTLTAEERDVLYKTKEIDPMLVEQQHTAQAASAENVSNDFDERPAAGEKAAKAETVQCRSKQKRPECQTERSLGSKTSASTAKPTVEEADSEQQLNEKSDIGEMPDGDDAKPASSVAALMMASFSKLKADSSRAAEQAAKKREEEEAERLRKEEEALLSHKPTKRYVPSAPIVVQTAASLGLEPAKIEKQRRVRRISRPKEIEAMRYDLPVSAQEFEVVDAVRNHDVTILCAETGSGKSTQVPQFLYEAGMSVAAADESDGHDEALAVIGVTQPRRVAAVSTAKRVCYEMGHGDGQRIPNGPNRQGNPVAYQTRYETAGLGSKTHIKFMTDGILLQEIQSDLLLRKYSVIILDEAHERNLNTDVLMGLLSAALPLRKQAAEEPGSKLKPLKVVIMSATLRVEDFTDNQELFKASKMTVVKVPGRTHQVTIHHSKVTELDNYEDVAFRKTCKIHRQLPQGGVLVFLTGKQEIVRMVNRLRRALNPSSGDNSVRQWDASERDVVSANDSGLYGDESRDIPRDMDDDEVDGDLFQSDTADDNAENEDRESHQFRRNEDNDGIPERAIVLPLYSLLSGDEQAKVFAPVPEGYRLIVVATNVAETSITIPGISYVVDSGRQKCRNYHTGTGVASFDIMWISRAAADQRAGRAGRTGPGHCYRLYSSSMYSRHMDAFSLPEALTRPLEDVVLAMKAMRISNVANFPFPTPPDRSQIESAVQLLANLGCVDLSKAEDGVKDGEITRLGSAVAKLPLGVRFGKTLLVAAEAGVLDYALVIVAALSEQNPFVAGGQVSLEGETGVEDDSEQKQPDKEELTPKNKEKKSRRWTHKGGDLLASLLAVGAYTYAGRGAGGASEKLACGNFCRENGLNPVVLARIQKMRTHLARLSKTRLGSAEGVAAKTGGFLSSMKPPNKRQESLLVQAIASGLLDNIAMLAPLGSIPGEHPFSLRSAYLSCSSKLKEPLFLDRNSVIYSRDARLLPKWICYETVLRKTTKDGTPVVMMKNITPIDPAWLGSLAKGSRMLTFGPPLPSPLPVYDPVQDAILCSITTRFGCHNWEIPPVKAEMYTALQSAKRSSHFLMDDSFRWFARFLLEGKVLTELNELGSMLNESPSLLTRRIPATKGAILLSALSRAGVDSAAALRKHWAEVDKKLLFSELKNWIKADRRADFKKLWMDTVKRNIQLWKQGEHIARKLS